jgi:hypothetical protein
MSVADDQPDLDHWRSRQEAAEHARCSISKIDRAIKSGELRSVKRDGRRLTTVRWVDAWLLAGAALLVVYLLLTVACRLGFEPAQDAPS